MKFKAAKVTVIMRDFEQYLHFSGNSYRDLTILAAFYFFLSHYRATFALLYKFTLSLLHVA